MVMFFHPLRLRLAAKDSTARLPFHVDDDPVRGDHIFEKAKLGPYVNSRAVDRTQHSVQIPRFDRATALQDETTDSEQFVFGDPTEEVRRDVQGKMNQTGGRDGGSQTGPNQVQPRPGQAAGNSEKSRDRRSSIDIGQPGHRATRLL
jgi:hypothetical protein